MRYILFLITGFLWAWAGAEGTSKNWRRIGVPIAISLFRWTPWGLLLYLPLSLGYGIPDGTDEGSPIGRFFYRLAKKNEYLASIYTRIFIGILYGICIGVVTGSLVPVAVLGITVPLFGAIIKTEPQVKAFGKVLNTEEFIIGALVGLTCI
jgi:hypothetical protein